MLTMIMMMFYVYVDVIGNVNVAAAVEDVVGVEVDVWCIMFDV